MSKGFIQIDCEMLNDPLYNEGKFDRMRAFLDLLFLAAYKERTKDIRGNKVTIHKGQVAESLMELANRWHWSVNTVRKFLSELTKSGYIDIQKTSVNQIIIIFK